MSVDKIQSPQDIKRLSISELYGVADRIRERIIDVVGKNGGHLSSNLGTVELTVALHYVLNCPTDKLIFDVGHQAYAHKILTGRDEAFDGLRQNGGISGFPKPSESEYDAFVAGHASTSLSVALGYAEAARLKGESYTTVAVIGDGALTGGMAYEAMNEIGSEQVPMIIVLNDNEMSISKNVGAMSKYLTRLRVSGRYKRTKSEIKNAVSAIPLIGDGVSHILNSGKKLIKRLVLSNKIFEAMGISYFGPFDGHNIRELVEVFTRMKKTDGPVLIHVITGKGRGLTSAINDPAHSHGVSGDCGESGKLFSDTLGEFLMTAAENDPSVVAITAAMAIGTGLEKFAARFPERFKDVGIAEEHAVTYASALAAAGLKPYFAVYSTFLQRAFDQLMHDACIGNYAVKLCVDRAGAVGSDGVTHQGLFDLSYLSLIPNMTVMCPSDGAEFLMMLEYSRDFDRPLAMRYPKSYKTERPHEKIVYGKWETVKAQKSKCYALCVGPRALDIAEECAKTVPINIINCRFVKPLDTELLDKLNVKGNKLVTIEDNVERGGFGESVLCYLQKQGKKADVAIMAHGNEFIDNRSVADTFKESGITAEALATHFKGLEK